jgi:hypothetical protein
MTDILNIVKDIMACITCIVLILQLRTMIKNSKADHERRKKQATIEFYNHTGNERNNLLDQIINVCKVEEGSDMLNTIKGYLANMERLAVGINTGIYDITVFDRMAGNFTIRTYDRLREIIDSRRKVGCAPYLFSDFEKLVLDLKKLRNERFPTYDKDFAKMKHDI